MVNIEHRRRSARAAQFFSETETFHADTCEPLRAATTRKELAFTALARGTYPGHRLAEKSLPNVRSIGYWDARHDQRWGLDWHRNEGVEITYLARGKMPFAVDNVEYQLSRGNLTVTRPWQLHRVGNPCVTACRILSINHERTITDVAFDCGFSSSQYFATVFRQHLGVAPNLFRRAGHDRAPR